MRYRTLIILFTLLIVSCRGKNNKIDLVVYPDYCGGCVTKNFSTLNTQNLRDTFTVHFDTSDLFILNTAKLNNLNYSHINNSEISSKFGDYANIVVVSSGKPSVELRTTEVLTRGKHF